MFKPILSFLSTKVNPTATQPLPHPKPSVSKGRVEKPKAARKKRSTKRTKITTQTNSNATLLGLPGELRNKIYTLALTEPEPINVKLHQKRLKEPPFLQVCKPIRSEAASIFYSSAVYSVEIRDFKFATLLKRLRKISDLGVKTLRFDPFKLSRSPGFNVEDLVDLVKGVAEIGIKLRDYYGRPPKLRCGGLWGFDYGDLLTLGETAHEEGWTEQVLEDAFLQWLDGE